MKTWNICCSCESYKKKKHLNILIVFRVLGDIQILNRTHCMEPKPTWTFTFSCICADLCWTGRLSYRCTFSQKYPNKIFCLQIKCVWPRLNTDHISTNQHVMCIIQNTGTLYDERPTDIILTEFQHFQR